MGRRMPLASQRHVRLRAARSPAPMPVPRPRPAGGEAAAPCAAVGRLAGLRVGTEGAAAPPAAAAGSESVGGRGFPRTRLCPRRQLHRRGRAEAARRPLSAARTRQAGARADALVVARFFEAHPGERRRGRRTSGPSDARRRDRPHGRRRAARGFPVGRGRQQRRRRADGRGEQQGGQDLHNRFRPGGARRNRICTGDRRTFRDRPPHPHRVVGGFRSGRQDRRYVRRTLCRRQRFADIPRVRTRARGGDGGAVGRRCRRGVRAAIAGWCSSIRKRNCAG